jgi:hypothetical protein
VRLASGSFTREPLLALAVPVSPRAFGHHRRLPGLIVVAWADVIGDVLPRPDMLSS